MTMRKTQVVGNGISTKYSVAHLFGTEDVQVGAYDQNNQYVLIFSNTVTKDVVEVEFLHAPRPGEYTIEVSPA
jgi:hypothetical protein